MPHLFLQALHNQPVDRYPVWLMRQAGRYLPEYRALRKKYSLKALFTHPELIYQATLLPLETIRPDAAILFSDITMPALSFGLDLDFKEGVGPVITPVKDPAQLIDRFDALSFVGEAIRMLKKDLKIPLIGFCGAPFTLSCYFSKFSKKWLYEHPDSFHLLLRKITDSTKNYLQMQIEAGVDAIQIFDSWANLLPQDLYHFFSLSYIQELIDFVKAKGVPVILFARGSCLFAKDLIKANPSCISFDWHLHLSDLRKMVPKEIVIQGNFDPDLLYASFPMIETTVKRSLSPLKKQGFIVNLGHGLKPDMDPAKVRCFVEAVKSV